MDAADHFTITAARRVDHRMVDGHLAEFTVPAAELPDSLASTADPEPLPAVAALSEADPPVSQVPRARHSKR
jgi:hypothetical protein